MNENGSCFRDVKNHDLFSPLKANLDIMIHPLNCLSDATWSKQEKEQKIILINTVLETRYSF